MEILENAIISHFGFVSLYFIVHHKSQRRKKWAEIENDTAPYMIDHFTDIDWESKYVINNNNPIINQ